MNARTLRAGHPALVATIVAALLLTLTPPAQAGSSSSYRVTGRAASTDWTQVDGTPIGGPFGNVHVGYLSADEISKGKAAVYGYIQDFDCEEGEVPGHGGHGIVDDEPEGNFCDWIGTRGIDGYNIPFTMDKKLNTATLKGQLTVLGGGHGGDVVGRPQANIVWTGVGNTSSERYTSSWREGTTTYSETYRATGRGTTMSGTLGPMGFDPDLSGGWMYTFKASSRSRTR